MKKIITTILLLTSLNTFAQKDSTKKIADTVYVICLADLEGLEQIIFKNLLDHNEYIKVSKAISAMKQYAIKRYKTK